MMLSQRFAEQAFSNGYELVDGVAMHAAQGDRFQIPHDVLKKHLAAGQFVEVRIDSARFSVHPDAPEQCTCASCNAEATNPILSHEQPATLYPLPPQPVPSRGWGEDFWVQILEHDHDWLLGRIDNPLYEARRHGLQLDDTIVLHRDHVLAIHPIHRQDLVARMDETELKALARWLGRR